MCWTYHPDTAIDYLERRMASVVWKRLESDRLNHFPGKYPSSHNHGSEKWVSPIIVSFHLG